MLGPALGSRALAERLASRTPPAPRKSPTVSVSCPGPWGGRGDKGSPPPSSVPWLRSVLRCFCPSMHSLFLSQRDPLRVPGSPARRCTCIQGGPFLGGALPPMASCQTDAGRRRPLGCLVRHPVALRAPAALSSGVANVHPASRTCLPCISLSEILRVSFCPFHICPGLLGLFFESIKQLLSVPLMWVVNRDSLKVSPDRAMCREALRSSGKAGRSGGLGEGLGPRGQQPGTEGKGPEQHGDSAP